MAGFESGVDISHPCRSIGLPGEPEVGGESGCALRESLHLGSEERCRLDCDWVELRIEIDDGIDVGGWITLGQTHLQFLDNTRCSETDDIEGEIVEQFVGQHDTAET